MKHTSIRKPLSVLLSILMALSVFSVTAFAGPPSDNTGGELNTETGNTVSPTEKIIAAAPFSALAVPEGTPLTDQLPSTQGTYYLTQDITISSTWLAPSGATTLDLNGYGIRMTGTGTVIDVCRDASCVLTLNDSRPTYSGGENRPSGILGGYITGGTGSKDHPGTSSARYTLGGGIYVNNAVLNINGGTITGNSAAWGGGIYIYNDCTVNMTGGAITGNSCARGGYGGGVFLSATSTFNVSHTPSIMGNYYSYNGKQYPKNVHMQVVASGGKPLYAVITIVSPGLTAGAQIGISELQTNAYPVTSGYSTYHSGVDPGTYFSSDTAGYAYKVNSEGELLSVPAFTITWLNEDGSLIDTTTVAGGTVPTHADATKDATAQYTYTFAGWSDGTTTYAPDDALPEAIRNATYTATFTQTDREYTITWKNDDGSVIDTTTVPYGTVPTHADATKDADALYTYTFTDWDPAIAVVSGNATYTAQYDKDYKQSVKDLIDEAEDVVNDETYDEDYRDDIQDDLDVLADPDATDEEKKAAAEDLEKKLSDEEKEANTLYTLTVYANGAVVRTVRGKEGDRVNLAVPAAPDKFYFTGWTVTAGSVNGNDYTFARADAEAVANFKLDPTVAEDLIDKAEDILGEGDDVYEDEYLDELQEKLDELNDAINNGADEETVKNLLDELEAIVNDANNNKHVWGPWEIVKEADFGVTGLKRRYCTKDGCTHYQEMEYNISANLDREIQFTNMHGMHYIAHMGETDRYVYTDSKALKWYSGASLTFNVVTGSTFRYDDYVIFMNGQVLEANADGSFTIPAGDNRVVITIVGAVKGGDDQGATPSSGSGVCKLCGKDHGTTIWGRIVAFFHLIVYFFKNLFK